MRINQCPQVIAQIHVKSVDLKVHPCFTPISFLPHGHGAILIVATGCHYIASRHTLLDMIPFSEILQIKQMGCYASMKRFSTFFEVICGCVKIWKLWKKSQISISKHIKYWKIGDINNVKNMMINFAPLISSKECVDVSWYFLPKSDHEFSEFSSACENSNNACGSWSLVGPWIDLVDCLTVRCKHRYEVSVGCFPLIYSIIRLHALCAYTLMSRVRWFLFFWFLEYVLYTFYV